MARDFTGTAQEYGQWVAAEDIHEVCLKMLDEDG